MKKVAVAHKEILAVPVTIKKEDFTAQLEKFNDVDILKSGVLLKAENNKDFRKNNAYAKPHTTGKADGVLLSTVEFKGAEKKEAIATVLLEGIVYMDELKTGTTKDNLPDGITYIYKNRVIK